MLKMYCTAGTIEKYYLVPTPNFNKKVYKCSIHILYPFDKFYELRTRLAKITC